MTKSMYDLNEGTNMTAGPCLFCSSCFKVFNSASLMMIWSNMRLNMVWKTRNMLWIVRGYIYECIDWMNCLLSASNCLYRRDCISALGQAD